MHCIGVRDATRKTMETSSENKDKYLVMSVLPNIFGILMLLKTLLYKELRNM